MKDAVAVENPFVGTWYGFYGNGREVLLGVEKVKGDDVTAVYALGPGLSQDQKAEWVRRNGRMSDDEIVFKERGRNTLRYRMSRIDELTGLDFTDADDRLKVEIALRILDAIGPVRQ